MFSTSISNTQIVTRTIDVHSHIFLPEAFEDLPERYRKDAPRISEASGGLVYVDIGGERRGPVPKAFYSLRERFNEMEEENVDMEVLSVYPYTLFYWLDADETANFARRQNDAIARVVKDNRDKFRGLATVPLQSVAAAKEEMERAILKLGLVGVEIGTNVNGMNLDDPSLYPFFERAEELNALILVHPIRVLGQERMRNYYLSVLVGNPSETSIAAASLIFGGVLERYPSLKVCFAHGGGFIPYQIGRLDRGYEVRPEPREMVKARPSSFLGRVYFDTVVYNESALSLLVSAAGAHNILLGSDSPLDMHDHGIVEKIKGLSSCSGEEKEMILGGNLERLVRV